MYDRQLVYIYIYTKIILILLETWRNRNEAIYCGRNGGKYHHNNNTLCYDSGYPLDKHEHPGRFHCPGYALPRRDHAVFLFGGQREPGIGRPGTRRFLQPVLVLATAVVAGPGRAGQFAQIAAHPRVQNKKSPPPGLGRGSPACPCSNAVASFPACRFVISGRRPQSLPWRCRTVLPVHSTHNACSHGTQTHRRTRVYV